MKKGLIWLIVVVVVLVLIGGIWYYNSLGGSSSALNFDFGGSEDAGEMIGEVTDVNSFDDVKLNPFEDES